MKDIIIVGAGGFGRETLMAIKEINVDSPTWNVLGFIDDNLNVLDGIACDKKVVGSISDWNIIGNELYVLAIANTTQKKKIATSLKEKGARFANIIHPTVRLGHYTKLGEGIILFPYADISVNCILGDFVFCNVFSQVGHDAIIGDYCTLFPNVSVSGASVLGEGVTMGTASSTHPGIKVGDFATVGMNSAVVRNVRPGTTVMGVPAKKVL